MFQSNLQENLYVAMYPTVENHVMEDGCHFKELSLMMSNSFQN